MIDVNRALQPLNEAERAIAQLQTYESSAELASALQAVNAAVQKTLRSLLRFDRGAPDDLRLAALSPTELAPERLIPALRQRDLISLQLAGSIHELDQASQRAGRGQIRASDGDLGLRVVDQLRDEIQNYGDRDVRAVAHTTVTSGVLDDEAQVVPAESARKPWRIAVILATMAIIGVLIWALTMRDSRMDRGIAAYNAGKFAEAQQIFQQEVDDNVANATAAFYLSRLYRRERRYDEAGKVLRRAVDERPDDAYLRAEFGNLFMDLQQPAAAARQYQRAIDIDADNPRNWVALVRAQRAAGDPNAEVTLQRAPDEARALLQGRR